MSDEKDKDNGLTELLKLSGLSKKTLSKLSTKEVEQLRIKFGLELDKNETLAEVAKQYEITRQRIRDIEEKALKKLKNKDDDDPDDDGPEAE